jgi:bacillithiol synthase
MTDRLLKSADCDTFFDGNRPPMLSPDAPAPDWDALVARVRGLDISRYPHDEIRNIIVSGHERIGAPDAVRARAESVGADTVFVVAGQQAGLFGGPLYTWYKAMHAVRLASRLADATGRDVRPLFWIASDDHDLAEIDRHIIRGANGEPSVIEYLPAGTEEGMPASALVLDDGISGAAAILSESLPKGDRGDRYREVVAECWRPGTPWCDAFARHLLTVLGKAGLMVFDPTWQGVRRLFTGIYRNEIAEPGVSTALLNAMAHDAASARERKRSIRRPTNATNLFMLVDGIREPLYVDAAGGFRAGGARFSADDLNRMIDDDPAPISPAAALRPLCQDTAMPVAATIAGPGERVYLGQAGALSERFGVDSSRVWPRASFTVVEPRIVRAAAKEKLPLTALFHDADRLARELAEESIPTDVTAAFDSLGDAVRHGIESVATALRGIDPTLVATAEKEAGRLMHGIDRLHDRAIRAHKDVRAVSADRFRSALAFLTPDAHPQERRYGLDVLYPFLGDAGIAELTDLASPDEEYHRIVTPG